VFAADSNPVLSRCVERSTVGGRGSSGRGPWRGDGVLQRPVGGPQWCRRMPNRLRREGAPWVGLMLCGLCMRELGGMGVFWRGGLSAPACPAWRPARG
jgi:hypothetical protein